MLHVWTPVKNTAKLTKIYASSIPAGAEGIKFLEFPSPTPHVEPGDVLIALGANAVKQLQDEGALHKGRTINSLRDKTFKFHGAHLMVSFSPAVFDFDVGKQPLMQWDMRLAYRLASTGSTAPKLGRYRWVPDFSDACEYINANYDGKALPVALDLETIGFDPWAINIAEGVDARIVSVSFTYAEGMADVYYVREDGTLPPNVHRQIEKLCTSKKVKMVGANLKYDIVWMLKCWAIRVVNQKFDTFLVGSLLNENMSNGLNVHAKMFSTIGGYDDCVAPQTLLCTDRLTWKPAGEFKAGEGLLGFDEFGGPGSQRRRLRRSKVVSTRRLFKEGVLVTLSNGREIRCSTDHGFLAHRYKSSNGPFDWVRAKDLKVGCRIQPAIDKREAVDSRLGGYLAGLYDGEGYLSHSGNGLVSGLSQKPGPVWDKYCSGMEHLGIGGFYSNQKNGDGVLTSKQSGGPTLEMLQILQPVRLLDKYGYEGKCIPSGVAKVWVAHVEPIGDIEVVSLETTSHTFVAEGICSHNSFNNTYDKGRMDLIPKEDLLPYAGGDTDACLQVSRVQRNHLLRDRQLTNFYMRHTQRVSDAFANMEYRGVVVDIDRYKELKVEVKSRMEELHTKAVKMLPRTLQLRHRDKLSLTRPSIIKEFMFTPHGLNLKPIDVTAKSGEPSTAKSHLQQFADHPEAGPFIEALSEWGSAKKTMSTYITGFMSHIRSDGKFHPVYYLGKSAHGGTDTGRSSAKYPAIQTLPKHTIWAKPLRTVYVPPEGHVILKLDYSQGELRVTACVANETTMIQTYRDGIDLHLKTGAQLNGYTTEEALAMMSSENQASKALIKKIRQGGKVGNFGLIYGMSPGGLVAFAWAVYGVKLSIGEATNFKNSFFKLYPRLTDWHNHAKSTALRNKFVRSPLGRIRHLPLINSSDQEMRARAERQSINAPIQGTLSDMCELAIAILYEQYPELWTFGFTHDEAQFYVPEDDVVLWATRIKEVMENLPLHEFGWNPPLTFVVDADYSAENLALCEDLIL